MFITLIVYQKQLINLKKELRELEKRYNSDCFDIKLNEYKEFIFEIRKA